jgi:type I restriction enzyme S subunit
MAKATKNKSFYNSSIPEDWAVIELGLLGKFSKGKGILKEQVIESGLPCIRYGEIYTTHDFIISKFKSFINEDVAKESQEIKKGDILFAGSGEKLEEIGKAVALIGNEKAFAGGDVIILSANKKVNVEYLSYTLESNYVRKQKRRLGQGHSIVHIYPSDLATLKIPLPPLTEQTSIANIFSLMHTAIIKNNSLIAKKELQKKWLMHNLMSRRKRLEGFIGQWKDFLLGDFVEIIMGQSPEGNTYNNAGNGIALINGPTEFTEKYPVKVQWTTSPTKICKEGDILLCVRGSSTGRLNIANEKYCIGRGIAAIRAKENSDHAFVEYIVENAVNKIIKLTTGSTFPNIDSNSLRNIKVHLPQYSEQTAIAKVLQAVDKEIQLLKTKTEKLRSQKKGVMQALLTGKKRFNIK